MRARVAVVGISLLALLGVVGVGAGRTQTTDGCGVNAPVAHHAGGVIVSPSPAGGPVACGETTGFGGSESRINVTNDGAAIYEPAVVTPGPLGFGYALDAPGPRTQTSASPAGLAVKGAGGTWLLVKPMGMTWEPQDHQGYVDRATGRFFWYALNANPAPQAGISPAEQAPGEEAHLFWTADDGKTWTHTTTCCPAFSENPRFVANAAPAGGDQPTGYANVVYFCANSSILLVSPAGARVCSRSLDGGSTWTQASILFSKPAPQHSECGSTGEDFGPTDGNYPQPGPDGSLYVLVACGGKTFLAKSSDEAATWPVLRAIPAGDELRTDPAGNLYKVRQVGGSLLLSVSKDEGVTWTPEANVEAPGVIAINDWYVAVRDAGDVAVSYFGQVTGQTTWAGYLTETKDALDAGPPSWSGDRNGSLL